MRIIGGIHRKRQLKRVNKESTRETADMVREAVFNVLGGNIDGIVLDLFAGSGAYGLEAISRGASYLYSNDYDKDAYKTITSNVNSLNESSKVSISCNDYKEFLRFLKSKDLQFDYIFIDPPYAFTRYDELINELCLLLNVDGVIIVETDLKTSIDNNDNYTIVKEKVYGRKKIYFVNKNNY